MCFEPLARERGHLFERAGFFEEVGGPRHDLESLFATEPREGDLIEFNDGLIVLSNDEQRRRFHV